ncbi:MAG: Wzz/FepE/Etk N-terminal domain-containing protein [Candidatus Margulisiibacteriota bacterium]
MEDEINLLDYWRVIQNYRKMILSIVIIFGLFSLIYSYLQPKLYKASSTILLVDTGTGGLASALAAVPFLSGGMSGAGSDLKIIPILKSATLAKSVSTATNIKSYEKLMSAVDAERDISGLLTIFVEWPNPNEAAIIANAYVEQLGKFLNNRSLNINYLAIDQAIAPKNIFKPKIKQDFIIACIAGLFFAVSLSFFLNFVEKSKVKFSSQKPRRL